MDTKKTIIVSVLGPDNVWSPVNVNVNVQQFIQSVNKKKYITSIARNGFMGGEVKDVKFNYTTSEAEKDLNN